MSAPVDLAAARTLAARATSNDLGYVADALLDLADEVERLRGLAKRMADIEDLEHPADVGLYMMGVDEVVAECRAYFGMT